jgi:23S rRNA pseudouridine1911/1915/1917 synthase
MHDRPDPCPGPGSNGWGARTAETVTACRASVPDECCGRRLDHVLTRLFGEFSRSLLQRWLRQGRVTVDGRQMRAGSKVRGGEHILVLPERVHSTCCVAQEIPLSLLYEDDTILVIDKPAGLVVHPAAGNWDGTLQNALLHRAPELAGLPRSGIVHRLDKNTSGLLVVARTARARRRLVEQLQERSVRREYRAVVVGVVAAGGTIGAPIGRHPVHRKRMAVVPDGRSAVTHFRVLARYRHHSLLDVHLETGRTHQIRVHLAHLRYPIIGDCTYGGCGRARADCAPSVREAVQQFARQALHAARLELTHPQTGARMAWESALPPDMAHLVGVLREDRLAAAKG